MTDFIFDVFGEPYVALLKSNKVLKVVNHTKFSVETKDGKTYPIKNLWKAKDWIKSRNTIH